MQRLASWGMLVGFCLLAAGCGGSDQRSDDASGNVSDRQNPGALASSQSPPLEGTIDDPAETVEKFLAAVKAAYDRTTERLLTVLAREKTAEMDIVVAPPGSETASFVVGEVEYVPGGQAHVASTWTELDAEGRPQTDQILWALRRSAEGWRIAGMATRVFEDQPPLFLNFEDPADMFRKQRLVEEEIQRRGGGQPTENVTPGSAASVNPPSQVGGPSGRIGYFDHPAGASASRPSGGGPQKRRENTAGTPRSPRAVPPRRFNR